MSGLPNPATIHQSYSAFPQVADATFVDQLGNINPTWARFLINLWQKLGGSMSNVASGLFLALGANGTIDAYSTQNGQFVAQLATTTPIPGPVVPFVPINSPVVYVPLSSGTVIVSGATVELSRDGVNFYLVSVMGGAIPVLLGDSIRITWYGIDTPLVTLFESG